MTTSSSSSPEIHPAPTAGAPERFTYKHATHEEVLEDLSSRFLLNLPDEELSSLERICFQVEQAHWFYEDFVREQNPKFPSLPLKKFSEMLFHACPLLHQWSHDHEQAFNTFMQYKTRVPVCGAIMLNETWEKCILVKGWKSSSGWGFPKGKINEHEPPHECAIREVLEETGYNLAGQINAADVIEMSIKEQLISLFIVPGVPEDFPFKTRTRKEISRIEWFKLTDLPTWKRNRAAPGKFYLISPFIAALKAFIVARKPRTLEVRSRKTVSYIGGDRGAQESSSSSADTGELQTPSPQYSEAIPASNDRVVATRESDDEKVIFSESMDPHFARLLNSLSLSAAQNIDLKPSHTAGGAPPLPEHSLPSNRLQTPDWSSRVPSYTDTSLDKSPGLLRAKRVSTQNSLKASHQPEHQNIIPSEKSEATPTPFDVFTDSPSATLSAAPISTASSSSPSALARKQTASSRRSSSIADISPYLSRPTEVPTSGKRLKQLALLESVADESSKMTPTLMNRELPSIHGPNRYAGRHIRPSVSVPPPPTCGAQVDFRSPYDPFIGVSGPPLNAIRGANTAAMHASYHPAMVDPFQVRPRSDQLEQYDPAYSVGFSGYNSMNQNQLLSLLAGPPQAAPPTGLSGGPLHAPFPRSSTLGYPTTPFHSVAPSNIFPSVNPHSAMQHPAPSTLPSPRPSTRGPSQSRSHLAPSSAQLLSILNSGNVAGARASISRTGPPSTGVSIHAG